MINTQLVRLGLPTILLALLSLPAAAQSFRVQCPTSTITHPTAANNNAEPAYTAPTYTPTTGSSDFTKGKTGPVNGAIKCQQIAGGDGYSTMGDGSQTYMFSFGPLSGLADIASGKPGTQFPSVFNTMPAGTLVPGDPATSDGVVANSWTGFPIATTGAGTLSYNGAVGLALDVPNIVSIYDISESG